jgi:hypothetical protein
MLMWYYAQSNPDIAVSSLGAHGSLSTEIPVIKYFYFPGPVDIPPQISVKKERRCSRA